MHKNFLYSIACLLVFLTTVISACEVKEDYTDSVETHISETAPADTFSSDTILSETIQTQFPAYINDTSAVGDKRIIIDANVEAYNYSDLTTVTLKFDDDAFNEMIRSLVISKYPDARDISNETGYYDWSIIRNDKLLLACSAELTGFVNYLDVLNDINGMLYESENLFNYGFITNVIPSQMTITAAEAAGEAKSLLEQYSCFSYKPWYILAADSSNSAESGYYYIALQAFYNEIPISVKCDTNALGISASALVSVDGCFQFWGAIPLKPSESKRIEDVISPEAVLSNLKIDFATFALGETVEIKRIALEFFPTTNDDDSFTLHPVWAFYCTDTRAELQRWEAGESVITTEYTYYYSADDGTFFGLYY